MGTCKQAGSPWAGVRSHNGAQGTESQFTELSVYKPAGLLHLLLPRVFLFSFNIR